MADIERDFRPFGASWPERLFVGLLLFNVVASAYDAAHPFGWAYAGFFWLLEAWMRWITLLLDWMGRVPYAFYVWDVARFLAALALTLAVIIGVAALLVRLWRRWEPGVRRRMATSGVSARLRRVRYSPLAWVLLDAALLGLLVPAALRWLG